MAKQDSLLETTILLIAKVAELPQEKITADTDLFSTGILDSLSFIELITAVAEDFSLSISPMEVTRDLWQTPSKIVEYLQSKES